MDPASLISIDNIPAKYRYIFSGFQSFNLVQSKVFDDTFNTDKTLVVSAPSGTGKTAILEIAIIRLLHSIDQGTVKSPFKVVYISPFETLCHERFLDWVKKFSLDFNLGCVKLENFEDIDYQLLDVSSLIFTTPEKWECLLRLAGYENIVRAIKLVLIDEVHLLNDPQLGPRLETLLTRLKTFALRQSYYFRFLAISASTLNTKDIGQWLGDQKNGVACYNLDDSYRSVKIVKVVIAFAYPDALNDFHILSELNSKLPKLIKKYSKERPTLIFCCSRKECQTTAEYLAENCPFNYKSAQRGFLSMLSATICNNRLKASLLRGIGFHHSGLSPDDRERLEMAFLAGDIPIMVATKALAMGVNFPAYLVIIKGTSHYVNGCFVEYDQSDILQMMGRAARPQFDDHGYAIILTKKKHETMYKSLVSGEKLIESNIHQFFAEIFLSEIEKNNISSLNGAVEWIRSTFFFVRVNKNREYYGLDSEWSEEKVKQKIRDICTKELNGLTKYELIEVGDDGVIKITEIGRIMVYQSVSVQGISQLLELRQTETIRDLLNVFTNCEDMNRNVILRNTDKQVLNQFNTRSVNEANRVIRFPFSFKIKTKEMKCNVLIQAILSCIPFPDDSPLLQEAHNVIKIGQRLSSCLLHIAFLKSTNMQFLLNCLVLAKCFKARLWENSKYVSLQIPGIDLEIASRLVNTNLTTFNSIENTDPREIERICLKGITFGDHVIEEAKRIPKYEATVENIRIASQDVLSQTLVIKINLINWEIIASDPDLFENHSCILLIGDQDSKILVKQRVPDKHLIKLNGVYETKLLIEPSTTSILIHYIDETHVGTDISLEYFPKYLLSHEQDRIRKIGAINNSDGIFKAFFSIKRA